MVVKLLSEKGGELKSKDNKHGVTPLSYTAVNEHSAVVKPLLEKSAEVESKEEKHGVMLPLWAAMNGRPTVPAVFSHPSALAQTISPHPLACPCSCQAIYCLKR